MKVRKKSPFLQQRERSPFLQQQYTENEIKANRIVAIMLLIFATFPISNELALLIEDVAGMDIVNRCVFIPLGVLVLAMAVIAWRKKFTGSWIRPMLMTGFFTAVGISFFIFTTFVSFLIFLPVFVSMIYLDLRYTQKILVITMVIFVLDCIVNLYLEQVSPIFRILHLNTTYNLWLTWLDAFLYVILPVLMTVAYVTVFIVNSMRNFGNIMYKQAENSEKIAKLNSELSMARSIQDNTLPKLEFETAEGDFAISCSEIPAKEVGGDFYDYFCIGDNILVFMIADVSDKGLPAAMFMMAAKKAIHCAVSCEHSLEKAIKLANKLICEDANGMFLTLWLAIIDTSSGVGKFVNAGHLPPYLRKANGEVEKLGNDPDLFMGPFPDQSPAEHAFRMEEGDVLFLYTDGLTDAVNTENENFGEERLYKAVKSGGATAASMRASVQKTVDEFTTGAEQFDDMTVLAVECRKLKDVTKEEFTILSGCEGTEYAITKVNELLDSVGCPENARRNTDVIIDEVLTNIHEHAYEGTEKEIRLRVYVGSSFISLRFYDKGSPFDPTGESAPDIDGEPKIGGLGIWLYRNLADKVRYCYQNGQNELAIRVIWNI